MRHKQGDAQAGPRAGPRPSESGGMPPAQPPAEPASRQEAEALPYGCDCGGRPKTWTGQIVSLSNWKRLSAWERHGSTGKKWNGLTGQWEPEEPA